MISRLRLKGLCSSVVKIILSQSNFNYCRRVMKEKYFDIYKNNKMYAKLVLVEFAFVYIYSNAH